MSEKISPELKKQVEIFASLVPEDILKKSIQKSGVQLNEFVAAGAVPLILNPKYLGYMIKAFSRYVKKRFDKDVTVYADDVAKFMFMLNKTIDEIREKHPKKFALLISPLLGVDLVGSAVSMIDRESEKDILEIVAKNFQLRDAIDVARETGEEDGDDKDKPPPPKKVKPLGGGNKIFSSFQEQLDRMQILAGINKKVL